MVLRPERLAVYITKTFVVPVLARQVNNIERLNDLRCRNA